MILIQCQQNRGHVGTRLKCKPIQRRKKCQRYSRTCSVHKEVPSQHCRKCQDETRKCQKNEAEIAVISTPSLRREKSEKKYIYRLFGATNSLPFSVHGYVRTTYCVLLNSKYGYLPKIEIKFMKGFFIIFSKQDLSLLSEGMVWLYSRGLYRNLLIPRMAKIRPCYKRGRGRRQRVLRKNVMTVAVTSLRNSRYFLLYVDWELFVSLFLYIYLQSQPSFLLASSRYSNWCKYINWKQYRSEHCIYLSQCVLVFKEKVKKFLTTAFCCTFDYLMLSWER